MPIDPRRPSEWPNPEVPNVIVDDQEDPDALFDFDDIPDVDDWRHDDES